jgi:hypothetical protein
MTMMHGILDLPQGAPEGRIRKFADGIVSTQDDPVVPSEFCSEHNLRSGQEVTIEFVERQSRRRKSTRQVAGRLVAVEGLPPDDYAKRKPFADLTALDPQPRMSLEYPGCPAVVPAHRPVLPDRYGAQRGLIVSPPKAGKTTLLQNISIAVHQAEPPGRGPHRAAHRRAPGRSHRLPQNLRVNRVHRSAPGRSSRPATTMTSRDTSASSLILAWTDAKPHGRGRKPRRRASWTRSRAWPARSTTAARDTPPVDAP